VTQPVPSVTAEQDDLDLVPPEERRRQKIRRRLLISGIFVVLLAALCGYKAAPISHAVKAWHARRLAREASALIEQQQWQQATEKLQNAYLLDSNAVDVWRAIARLLWRSNQAQASLEWWEKIAHARALMLQDHRDYAACALATNQLSEAATQIDALPTGQTREPIDDLLAGQLASRRGDASTTLDYAERALANDRAKPNEIISAAILVLSVPNTEYQRYGEAWQKIESLARDSSNPMSLDALTFLGQHPRPTAPPPSTDQKSFALAQSPPSTGTATLSRTELADLLQRHPKARPLHHLIAMELRAQDDGARADELLDDAIRRFRDSDDEALVELGGWLYKTGHYTTLLEVLPLERAIRSRDLYLQHLDALSALGRFSDVADLLSNHRFNLDDVSESMYLAVAKEQLGQQTASSNAWQRALEVAGDFEKCMALGAFAERAGVLETAASAYARATSMATTTQAAQAAQLRTLEQLGKTAEAHAVAAKMVGRWPNDSAARLEEIYLRLLQGAPPEQIESAERVAEVALLQRNDDWNARKTLGLARLQLGKVPEALQVFRHVRVTGDEPPGVLAVRAAILFANGWKNEARGDARNLAAERLLPEERGLLNKVLSD
jgi:hypothetical protein